MNSTLSAPSVESREKLVARGLVLEYLTLAYNSLEALVALVSGVLAGSIALVGFGIDSIVELSSGAALVWRLRSDSDPNEREQIERTTLRVVGLCFMALAGYVGVKSLEALLRREEPESSIPGIAIAVASLVVMPLLARAKRRVALAIDSAALAADAKQTELCTYLSAILLGGLVLNATLGWWWADPVAALIMVPIIAKEGRDALRGRKCGCSTCH